MKTILIPALILVSSGIFAQLTATQTPTGTAPAVTSTTSQFARIAWYRGGNNPIPNTNNVFGTLWNSEVYHFTGGTRKFTTTINLGLTNNGFNSFPTLTGDGISISPGLGSSSFASIDLFSSGSNRTHFRLGQASLLQHRNNRVEHIGNFNGFWYNATGLNPGGGSATPQFIWNITQAEKGRVGSNGWWRFGNNFAVPVNANNIVEISTQNSSTAPYGLTGSGLRFRNLTSLVAPIPNGFNGVNSTRLLTVDINGDVVLTTPLAATTLANNGLQVLGNTVQLGGLCGNLAQENSAALLNKRKILLNTYNLYFAENPTQKGSVGFGDFPTCIPPGNLVEITKNNTTPSTTGVSGLQLGDLRTGAFVNPPNGMGLSVNSIGDVILVKTASSSTGVNLCNTAPLNNVVKVTAIGLALCATNITDLSTGSVGVNVPAPNDALDVGLGTSTTGDIDVNLNTGAYQISDSSILWHKGNSTNLFVGIEAGNAIPLGGGFGDHNVVIGNKAHSTQPMLGNNSVFVGYKAGMNTANLNNSTHVGAGAGQNNIPGAGENTLIGWHAGFNNAGLHNVCIGNLSGFNNAGFQNTFVGIGSGLGNITGQYNVSIGGGSGPGLPGISNSISIGNGSQTLNSNSMILGDNTVNVGVGLSGVAAGPANKMELNTTIGSPHFLSTSGSSGLRFRNMTTSDTPQLNSFNGVLSVDNNGDVILVQDVSGSSGSGPGNYCGSPSNPLISDFEVPLNNNNYNFSGDVTNLDKVNIGYNCGTFPLLGKLNVQTAFPSDQNIGSQDSYTIVGENTNNTSFSTNTGVYGNTNCTAFATNAYGVWGKASSTRVTIGVFGQGGVGIGPVHGGAFESKTPGNTDNIGLKAEAENAFNINTGINAVGTGGLYSTGGNFDAFASSSFKQNIGVVGRAFPISGSLTPTYPSSVHIGVYGQVPITLPPNPSLDYAGYFDGRVYINGNTFSPGYAIISDAKFKNQIQDLSNGLDIIRQIKPKSYYLNTDNNFGMAFSNQKQYGVIAQEVEKVLPELVVETKKPATVDKSGKTVTEAVDYKAVNYDGFIAILINSVQQLEEQNKKLLEQNQKQDQLIKELAEKMEAISKTTPAANRKASQSVDLLNDQTIVLDQNVPNPFADRTIITYKIPETASSAKIEFTSVEGRMIKSVEVTGRGKGELTVYGNDLSNGIYTYTLIIDGKAVDKKRMIKTK